LGSLIHIFYQTRELGSVCMCAGAGRLWVIMTSSSANRTFKFFFDFLGLCSDIMYKAPSARTKAIIVNGLTLFIIL